jgi:hypothetical protein
MQVDWRIYGAICIDTKNILGKSCQREKFSRIKSYETQAYMEAGWILKKFRQFIIKKVVDRNGNLDMRFCNR